MARPGLRREERKCARCCFSFLLSQLGKLTTSPRKLGKDSRARVIRSLHPPGNTAQKKVLLSSNRARAAIGGTLKIRVFYVSFIASSQRPLPLFSSSPPLFSVVWRKEANGRRFWSPGNYKAPMMPQNAQLMLMETPLIIVRINAQK